MATCWLWEEDTAVSSGRAEQHRRVGVQPRLSWKWTQQGSALTGLQRPHGSGSTFNGTNVFHQVACRERYTSGHWHVGFFYEVDLMWGRMGIYIGTTLAGSPIQ
jgi:hypothetical protein